MTACRAGCRRAGTVAGPEEQPSSSVRPSGVGAWITELRSRPDATRPALRSTVACSDADAGEMARRCAISEVVAPVPSVRRTAARVRPSSAVSGRPLSAADSIGRYVNTMIKPRYPSEPA